MSLVRMGYTGGWGELYEALAHDDLESAGLSSNATMEFSSLLASYRRGGFGPNTGVPRALEALQDIMVPTLISASEFRTEIHRAASVLLERVLLTGSQILLFPMHPARKVKSNLWVFLLCMQALQRVCFSDAEWRRVRTRIFLSWLPTDTDGNPTAGAHTKTLKTSSSTKAAHEGTRPKSWCVVILDDCIYSGSQAGGLLRETIASAQGRITHVFLCLPFATGTGLEALIDAAGRGGRTSVHVGRVVGWTSSIEDAKRKLFDQDIAFCIRRRAKKSPWLIMTLFQVLGIVESYGMTWKQTPQMADTRTCVCKRAIFSGRRMTVYASVNGYGAIAFAHKVADRVSIPTAALLVGRTLRGAIEQTSILTAVDSDDLEIATIPLPELVSLLDTFEKAGRIFRDADEAGGVMIVPTNVLDAQLKPHILRAANLGAMPPAAPILQPLDACGPALKRLLQSLERVTKETSSWEALVDIETTTMNGQPWFADEQDAAAAAQCIKSPYSSKLAARLQALASDGKCRELARLFTGNS